MIVERRHILCSSSTILAAAIGQEPPLPRSGARTAYATAADIHQSAGQRQRTELRAPECAGCRSSVEGEPCL
jgi:hypothetical protein